MASSGAAVGLAVLGLAGWSILEQVETVPSPLVEAPSEVRPDEDVVADPNAAITGPAAATITADTPFAWSVSVFPAGATRWCVVASIAGGAPGAPASVGQPCTRVEGVPVPRDGAGDEPLSDHAGGKGEIWEDGADGDRAIRWGWVEAEIDEVTVVFTDGTTQLARLADAATGAYRLWAVAHEGHLDVGRIDHGPAGS